MTTLCSGSVAGKQKDATAYDDDFLHRLVIPLTCFKSASSPDSLDPEKLCEEAKEKGPHWLIEYFCESLCERYSKQISGAQLLHELKRSPRRALEALQKVVKTSKGHELYWLLLRPVNEDGTLELSGDELLENLISIGYRTGKLGYCYVVHEDASSYTSHYLKLVDWLKWQKETDSLLDFAIQECPMFGKEYYLSRRPSSSSSWTSADSTQELNPTLDTTLQLAYVPTSPLGLEYLEAVQELEDPLPDFKETREDKVECSSDGDSGLNDRTHKDRECLCFIYWDLMLKLLMVYVTFIYTLSPGDADPQRLFEEARKYEPCRILERLYKRGFQLAIGGGHLRAALEMVDDKAKRYLAGFEYLRVTARTPDGIELTRLLPAYEIGPVEAVAKVEEVISAICDGVTLAKYRCFYAIDADQSPFSHVRVRVAMTVDYWSFVWPDSHMASSEAVKPEADPTLTEENEAAVSSEGPIHLEQKEKFVERFERLTTEEHHDVLERELLEAEGIARKSSSLEHSHVASMVDEDEEEGGFTMIFGI
ncbi:uncharacterized protein FSUBG_8660 [Fusarium subglutinans]|uniref:Uncharacterized protein n=1 Tax=Gibberella subglutinans TaxID=42677 RepID=A0A8H5PHW4_GIBSU|nr:uncharacterized protein FSUBG_8660 [Fusarium subglutinans]KAF5597009.1 hypothetical protein FSUBG_8660 [Fusarium subglutinans]